jgi:sporulation protein YlmC with PRC-barrel domain
VRGVLWRAVENRQDEMLGGVSDVLVQMPSGRIVFVAVDPSELFERPKAVPPRALTLPRQADSALQLNLSKDHWISAPRLDWDAALVIKKTEEGGRIYGFYQQEWVSPDPDAPWGMTVVASPNGTAPVARYVSLKRLLLNRIVTPAGQPAGFVRDFLLNWREGRAIYALVSPTFTPLAREDQKWFAVPLQLLSPRVEDDSLEVNSNIDAFRRARPLRKAADAPAATAGEIHLYPATPVNRTAGREARGERTR